jgi:hypothetical protein
MVCHSQPTIRGLRYIVESILQLLSAGMTIDEVHRRLSGAGARGHPFRVGVRAPRGGPPGVVPLSAA